MRRSASASERPWRAGPAATVAASTTGMITPPAGRAPPQHHNERRVSAPPAAKRATGSSDHLDGQPEDVVLADRLHALHVVLAGPRLEAVGAHGGEGDPGRGAHVAHHP